MAPLKIGVFGAGAIGCVVGVNLSAAGLPVVLLGRDWLAQARGDLQVRTVHGETIRPASDLRVVLEPEGLADVDVCLVAVKSEATAEAARALAQVLRPEAVVVSLQNGLRNEDVLRQWWPGASSPGVVTFNVVSEGPGRYAQATSGRIFLGSPQDARLQAVAEALRRRGVRTDLRADMEAVMAGKLLVNLNNGICGATGLTIAQVLQSAPARWCFSRCIREGYAVMRKHGIRPARVAAVGPRAMAVVMRLPDALLRLVAGAAIRIDPRADASTAQDLRRGRSTEIDELNGEIVRMAAQRGMVAPCNRAVVEAVREHERSVAAGRTPEWLDPRVLQARMRESLGSASAPRVGLDTVQ